MSKDTYPLIYSCSGCSNVAQLANELALRLDRADVAEMSCIAGIGGGVATLVRTARSGRPVVAIDGCQLHCSKACLARADVEPDLHVTLSDYGLRKRFGTDWQASDAQRLEDELVEQVWLLRRTADGRLPRD